MKLSSALPRRSLVLIAAASIPAVGWATPDYLQTFVETYKPGGKLKATACAICHTQVPRHNAYGVALNAAMASKNAFALDVALLRSIEAADSDGDGVSNGDEIRANTLPGDMKSKPPVDAAASNPASVPTATGANASKENGLSILPKNAFHPQLVHFPLALFLFGAALDLWGIAHGRSDFRKAGIWNMTAATIATALAIPTGFFAASLSGYELKAGSAVVLHLLFALGATAVMGALVAWRARREPKGVAYVALLLLASILVGWAGHLGGGLVYGG